MPPSRAITRATVATCQRLPPRGAGTPSASSSRAIAVAVKRRRRSFRIRSATSSGTSGGRPSRTPWALLAARASPGPLPDHPPLVLGCGGSDVGTQLAGGSRGALWVDLDSYQHLPGGGLTGGDKSVFLRQALTFLCCDHPARMAHIDLKGGVGLAHLGRLPHALYLVADTVAAAAEMLSRVREELDWRLSTVRRSVEAVESAAPASWPRIMFAVDEVAELTVRDLGDDRAARAAQQAAIGRLCEIARLRR